MNVVLEGCDGGGKSTLAEFLSRSLSLPIQQGSGPPRRRGEIEDRLAHYLTIDGAIFDRHPAISQPIYGSVRGEPISPEFAHMVRSFYASKPAIVYCRSVDASRHVVKPGENPDHIRILTQRYQDLVGRYDAWACAHATIIYRIGDSAEVVASMVAEIIAGQPA